MLLVIGLVLFLGVHSVQLIAPRWRQSCIDSVGPSNWRLFYALLSFAGLVLIVLGYGALRSEGIVLWTPPVWTRHLAALLMLPAFVLVVAAYLPGTRMRASIGHPMLAGVKLWSFSHLLANGGLADVLLFGSFLLWATASFINARRFDRATRVVRPPGHALRDVAALALGAALWFIFARYLHVVFFDVRPF